MASIFLTTDIPPFRYFEFFFHSVFTLLSLTLSLSLSFSLSPSLSLNFSPSLCVVIEHSLWVTSANVDDLKYSWLHSILPFLSPSHPLPFSLSLPLTPSLSPSLSLFSLYLSPSLSLSSLSLSLAC